MDLQVRKLNLIGYLIGLQDEKVFSKIESTIFENKKQRKRTKEVKTITSKQLIDRANRSDSDYKAGKIKTQEQLEIESENW